MKRIFFVLFFASLVGIIFSCSKSNDKSTLASSPEATSENDSKSGGVYKGVIIGSSGTVKVILQNNTISVEVTVDGETKVLPVTNLTNWTSGQAIVNAVFLKDNWKVTFSVAANGSNPQIKVEIPGHPKVDVTIIKESSSVQVKAYEGTYTATAPAQGSGTWNFISAGDSLAGIRRATGDTIVVGLHGSIRNGQIQISTGTASASGSISADEISGTWTDISSSSSGTWKGKRTL